MQTIKYSAKTTFCKKGEMIYFSQLDILHVIEKALRRSKLPIYYTQGFNPHPKVSLLNGLKLGLTGKIESILYFSEKILVADIEQKLSTQLPAGLEIISIQI